MSQNYNTNWKICATCAYWMGRRDCDHFNQHAIVSSSNESGTCKIPSGPWRNSSKAANASCPSYLKWPVLK